MGRAKATATAVAKRANILDEIGWVEKRRLKDSW